MKSTIKIQLFALFIGITTTQCGKSDSYNTDFAPSAMKTELAGIDQSEEMFYAVKEEMDESIPASNTTTIQQKIIKEGTLSFESDSIEKADRHIRNVVKNYQGYISNEWTNNYTYRDEINITLRVPANQFEKVIEEISMGVGPYASKNITATDVTEEFIDLNARITTKKETEQRYRELLQKANKVSEILEIEDHITTLRADIESLEGRLRYLTDRVGLSTLTVTLFRSKIYNAQNNRNQFADGLENGWEGLIQFFVILTNAWPILLFGILLYWIINRMIKRRKTKKQNA